MKKVFVKTNNVKRFITMMNNLQRRAEGVPGMGLVRRLQSLGGQYKTMLFIFAVPIICLQDGY